VDERHARGDEREDDDDEDQPFHALWVARRAAIACA
jgi:hypothetical protein